MVFKPFFFPPAFQIGTKPGKYNDQSEKCQHSIEDKRVRVGPLGVQLPAQPTPNQKRQEPGLDQQLECQQKQRQHQEKHANLNHNFHVDNLLYFATSIILYLKNLVKKLGFGMKGKTQWERFV
jgi:hypothetical protein